MIASGTWGTIPWSISDAGALTLGAGVQPWSVYYERDYPWHDYRQSITSVQFTGNISKRSGVMGGTEDITRWSSAFRDCQALASVSGLSYISNAVTTNSMFSGCSTLTFIDLSGFDTSKLNHIGYMFSDCPVLASVKFGAYGFGSLDSSSVTDTSPRLIDSNYKTAECNGIVVSSDNQFLALEKTEQSGTWTRNATTSDIFCTAQRTASGTAREDGDDVTFSFTWVFAEGATSAPATIYQKAAGDPSYPSTPTASLTLSGNAGNATYTIAEIGDGAYDYRVEIVDGSSTYVFFPTVTANIRLMDFDANGNAHVYGDLTSDGTIIDGSGNVLSDKLDSTTATSTYLPLSGGTLTGELDISEMLTVNTQNESGVNHGLAINDTSSSGHNMLFGIGTGAVNRGIFDNKLNGWLVHADDSAFYAGAINVTSASAARSSLGLGTLAQKSSVSLEYKVIESTSAKNSSAVASGGNVNFSCTCTAPSGYIFAGIQRVGRTGGAGLVLLGFDASDTGNTATLSFRNMASSSISANTASATCEFRFVKATVS